MSEKGKPHINEPDKAQAEAKELAPLQSPPPRGAEANAPEAGPADKKPVRNKFADKKKRHVPKVIKIGVPLLLVAAVIYGSVVLIRNLTKKEDENQIQTGIVSRGPLSQSVTGYGTIKPQLEAKYGDKTRGEVTEVAVNSGDTVHAGDLLFTVDPSELKKDLDEAYDDLNAARSRLEEAQDALNNLSVTAPFSGKLIDAPTLFQGQEVAVGTKLGKLVDDSYMTLAAYYSYAYIDNVAPGMAANVSVPDSMTAVQGTVTSVDRIKKVKDGAVLFRANITIKNPGTLVAGSSAAASLPSSIGEIMPAESGTLQNTREEEITTKADGKITFTSVMDYGEYTQGQTLLTVSNTTLRPALDSAQKSYDTSAKRVAELEADMQSSEVRADIDGMVSSVMVKVGDKLTASGTPVITVSDTSSLLVEVDVDELDVSKIQVGMPVEVTTGDSSDPANVPTIGTLVDLAFEAKVDQNGGGMGGSVAYFPAKIAIESDGKLLPGMSVNYKINTTLNEDCLQIPSSAVIYSEEGTVAYVRPAEGSVYENIAESVPQDQIPEGFTAVTIEIGIADEHNTEVISGLNEGDEVYMTSASQDDGMGGMMYGAAYPFGR